MVRGAGRDARSVSSLKSIPPRLQESREPRLPSHRPSAGLHVAAAGARHNGCPRSPAPASPHSPTFQWVPLPRDGQRAWPWAATRRNRSGQAGAPEPGTWGARPLAELSPVDRPAAEPASRPSLGAPVGSSRPTRARPRPRPQPAVMETGLRGGREAEAGRRG